MTPRSGRLTPGLLVALAFLAAVGPFATDLYLPAFTTIASDLGTSPSHVQLTLTAFMVGLGVGQLALGPLSDRLGRRSVLLVALGAFTAASIAMVSVTGIEMFVALRVVQGMAGAAGIVLSRAIIADLAKGAEALKALSLLAMIVAIAPLVAPIAGGMLTDAFGWRGVLAVLAGITALMFLAALLLVPETLPLQQRQIGGARRTLNNFARLLRDRTFVLLVFTQMFNFAAFLGYISGAPFVGQSMLGMSPTEFSFAFAAGALAMVLLNFTNARLAGKVPPTRMLILGASLVALAGTAFGALAVTQTLSVATYVACAFVLSGGVALVSSNSTALALGRADFARGSGSAILGAFQFAGGGLTPPLVGAWGDHTALPMALIIFIGASISMACALIAGRRLRGQ